MKMKMNNNTANKDILQRNNTQHTPSMIHDIIILYIIII
jgi:hypothetical protein